MTSSSEHSSDTDYGRNVSSETAAEGDVSSETAAEGDASSETAAGRDVSGDCTTDGLASSKTVADGKDSGRQAPDWSGSSDLSVLIVTSHRPEEVLTPAAAMDADTAVIRIDGDDGPAKRGIEAARQTRHFLRTREPDVILLDCFEAIGAPVVEMAVQYDTPVVARLVADIWRKMETEALGPAHEQWNPLAYAHHRLGYQLNEFIFNRVDGFVVVSTELADVVSLRTGCPRERVGVVPVPVTADGNNSRDDTPAEEFGITTERVLLTVTNLKFRAKFDGIETILSEVGPVLRSNPDLSYVIAGGGQYHSDVLRAIDERFGESDLRSRIHAPGYVDNVECLYSLAELFVYVSYLDGYPNAVLEAQAAGLPTIANDAHGMRDQITDGETGFLVDADRPGALRERVAYLLANPEERGRLGSQARQRVSQENSPGVVGRQLWTVLEDVLATFESS